MKRIKNKKTFIAIIAVLLVVVVGVTYALLFTNSSMDNIFGLGNYNVVTSETFTSPASWQPGVEIPKSITATNNGNIQAAFRVKYTESWVDSSNNPISNVPQDAVSINFINKHDWIYNSDDGYYYYKWIINSGDTTSSLISGITLNQDLTGSANCVEEGNTYNCSSSLSGLAGATYTLTFTKETVAYSKYQSFWSTDQNITDYQYLYTLPEGRTAYNLQVGDEICVNDNTTECFNFVRYDENNNIVMIAKYNLKVGKIYDSSGTQTGIYSSGDSGYGLQSSDAKGFVSGQTRYGTVAFSSLNYWYDGSSLKPKYGSGYPADVYDTDYATEPDFSNNGFNTTGYSVAYYVEEYKDKLKNYGVTIFDARLLTYTEATDSSIGCNGSNYSCPTNGFITSTSFWLGTANNYYYLWYVLSDGTFNYTISSRNDGYFGVRPVIVVSKSDVNNNVDDANKYIPPSPSSFATDSWETIAYAIRNNNTSVYSVGDTKTVDLGSFGTHTLRIANKSTPSECSSSDFSQTACGFVLEFVDIIATSSMNSVGSTGTSAIGGYPSSIAYNNYIKTDAPDATSIYKSLPLNLRNAIIDTYVVSSGENNKANYTTTDKLYLLSSKELYGFSVNNDNMSSTRQLDYYVGHTNGNRCDSNAAFVVKQYNGIDTDWWLRSARKDDFKRYVYIQSNGCVNHEGNSGFSTSGYGISPAFRIG